MQSIIADSNQEPTAMTPILLLDAYHYRLKRRTGYDRPAVNVNSVAVTSILTNLVSFSLPNRDGVDNDLLYRLIFQTSSKTIKIDF